MQKIKDFWINSYKSIRLHLHLNLSSFIFTVGASMTLALTARDPNMLIVYPILLVAQHNVMLPILQRRGMGNVTNRLVCMR